MQILSAYLLEAKNLNPEQLAARKTAVKEAVTEWLRQKGAADPALKSGAFKSLTAEGGGKFSREEVRTELGDIEEARLEEFSRGGQTFTTQIVTVSRDSRLFVHAVLSATSTTSLIAPVYTDPRCPAVIRKLLNTYLDWELAGNSISAAAPRILTGAEGVKPLVAELQSAERRIPLVVVSQNEGETLWPRLAEELAFDLAGLASVVVIDDEASWAFSDIVGKFNSCYRGAVRLYWPTKKSESGETRYPSTAWTATALLSNDSDGKGFNRFRSAVRRKVMGIASLTVVPPKEIREIRDSHARKRLEELEAKGNANSEELEIARLYITENQQLKADLSSTQDLLAKMTSRAEVAEYALGQAKSGVPEEEEAESSPEDDPDPVDGEIRFYKKTHSKPAYDVFVRVKDCGHASWQKSAKADKAKKGLERLIGGNSWKSLQHCGTCTGGGVWKVRW